MTPELREYAERWISTYDARRTREAYRVALGKLWSYWPQRLPRTTEAVLAASTGDIQAAAAAWSERKQPAARHWNLIMAAWSGFFSFLVSEGLRREPVVLKRRAVPNKPTREVPSTDEVQQVWAMLSHASLEALPRRELARVQHDRALFALLLVGGLRRCEVIALDVGDVTDDGDVILLNIRRSKRNKTRTVGLPGTGEDGERLRRILDDVRADRDAHEPLLLGPRGSRLGGRAAIDRLAHLFERATGKRYTPHCLRAWFATSALHRGTPIIVLAEQMGHSSIETTRGYDQLRHRVVAVGSLH